MHSLLEVKEQLEFMLESHQPTCRFQSSSPPDVKPNIHEVNKHNGQLQPEEFAELPCNGSNSSSNASTKESAENFDHNTRLNRPKTLPIFSAPRPSSLHFKVENGNGDYQRQPVTEIAGIPITTPSSGVPFNFESLMEGGTGLTPISTPIVPSCSSQQRNNITTNHHPHHPHHNHHHHHHHHNHHIAAVDLSSPDANPKLVSL